MLKELTEEALKKRIKSLCGAKPPQKLRWTNAGGWASIERYGDFTRDAWCRGRGSAVRRCGPRSRTRILRSGASHLRGRQRHLGQGSGRWLRWRQRIPWRAEARSDKTRRCGGGGRVRIMVPWPAVGVSVRMKISRPGDSADRSAARSMALALRQPVQAARTTRSCGGSSLGGAWSCSICRTRAALWRCAGCHRPK